jgi:isocitrate/isopropylmalate dehydrogenase
MGLPGCSANLPSWSILAVNVLMQTNIQKCIRLCFFFSLPGNIETGSLNREVISRNVALRNELDLFINVLHCKSYPGVTARQKDIDIIILRQNTEGEYAMLEHEVSTSYFSENKVCGIFVHSYFSRSTGH